MKPFLDFLMNSAAAVLLAVLAVLGLLTFLIPALHPFAWIVGAVLCLLLAGVLALSFREWSVLQHRIDDLNAELAGERGDLPVVGISPVELEETGDPDTDRAERLLALFPADSGLVENLRLESAFGVFPRTEVESLTTFLGEFKKTSFDHPVAHTAFMNLYRSAEELAAWFTAETSASARASDAVEITPGDEREQGWASYARARDTGEHRADDFVHARTDFHRIALECRVINA